MISGIGPERVPNGDFGGRSFQGVGGAPTLLRSAPVSFPGVPNKPGNDIGEPTIMRDTAGRRSNVTVQYSRVVPMGSKQQKAETEALLPGVLAWTCRDDSLQKRFGRSVERMYRIVSWDWLQSETEMKTYEGGHNGEEFGMPPQDPEDRDLRQKHALRDGGRREVGLKLDADVANAFDLNNTGAGLRSPYLMWKGWTNEGVYDRSVGNKDYDDLRKVRFLWENIYESKDHDKSLLLSPEVMGSYVPDGFVLYKYATEGTDSVAEGMLDDSQNGLFNIVVSGHAMATSWAVSAAKKAKRLVTLPRDTLFILVKGTWKKNKTDDGGWFVNLRYVRSTSEELIRNSTRDRRLGVETNVALKSGEFVLGAWRIGSVVDSAASRTRPSSFATEPVTPAQAMGLTVSVGIRWVTSYALHDMFYETEIDNNKLKVSNKDASAIGAEESSASMQNASCTSAASGVASGSSASGSSASGSSASGAASGSSAIGAASGAASGSSASGPGGSTAACAPSSSFKFGA